MGLSNWSQRPELNGVADPQIPAHDGASARAYPALVRGVMAEVARHASDQGGGLRTTGAANAYVISTASGIDTLRDGVRLVIRPDRPNTDAPTLNVDGTGPKPWLDAGGHAIPVKGILPDYVLAVTYDDALGAWRMDGALAIGNEGLAAMPAATLKGNAGIEAGTPVDLGVDALRTLLRVDHVANKTETEMVSDGPISVAFANVAIALATKATPKDITDALAPVNLEIAKKATPADIDTKLVPVVSNVSTLQSSSATQAAQISALQTGQKTDRITRGLYSDFAGMTLDAATTYEVLDRDTGTHPGISSEDGYDAGTGRVPNAGIFIPKESPLVLRRIGGTSAGAIPGLIADRDTLRATRSVSRPGENPQGWTTNVTAAPGAALPLALGGAFAVGTTVGGRALRIAGAAQAGPIAMAWIQPGIIYDLEIFVGRTIADSNENRVLPRIRAFGPDQVELPGSDGIIALPAVTLTVGDPLVPIKTSISTVPGAAALTFPVSTGGYARAYLSAAGATNGEIAVSELRLGPRSVSTLDALRSAPLDTAILDTDRIAKIDAAGTILSVSTAAAWAAYMEAKLAPLPDKGFDASGIVGTSPVSMIEPDATLTGFRVVNNSDSSKLAINYGAVQPAFDGRSIEVLPRGVFFEDRVEKSRRINIVASAADTPFFARGFNTSGEDPNFYLRAAPLLNRYSTPLTGAPREAVARFYTRIVNAGIKDKLADWWVLRAPTSVDRNMNWITGRSPLLAVGSMMGARWTGQMMDGVDDYFDTQRTLAGSVNSNADFAMGVAVGTEIQATGKYAMGGSSVRITANRTNVTVAFNAGTATSHIVTVGGVGGLIIQNREDLDHFTGSRDGETGTLVTHTTGALSTAFNTLIGAAYAGGVPAGFYAGIIDMAFVAKTRLTLAERIEFSSALADFKLATAGF